MRTLTIPFLAATFGLILAGCNSTPPPQKTVYLKNANWLKKYDLVPFQKVWKKKDVDLKKYDRIIVEPVDISKTFKNDGVKGANLDALIGEDQANQLREFAKYTADAFKKAIKNDNRLQLATKPGPKTMILKLGLAKVVPGKPMLGLLRNVPLPIGKAGFIVTPAIKLAGASVDELKSSVAIEGEILDSQTRKPIAMFTDNATEKTAFINTALLSSYGTPKEIVNQWAAWFVATLNRKPNEKIERGDGFKLIN